jgi:hypothetical protein
MADLEASLSLDIGEAQRDSDELAQSLGESLEAALAAAVESFQSSFQTATGELGGLLAEQLSDVPVGVDAANVPSDIDAAVATADGIVFVTSDAGAIPPEIDAAISSADATVPVDADTDPAADSLSSLVAEIESTDTTIGVDADTAAADAALGELSDQAVEAAGGLEGTAGAAQGLSVATDLASGSASSLVGMLGQGSSGAAKFGGAALAAGALVAGFTGQAINAEGATGRLDATLGEFADQINQITVGNLNVELGQLAVQTGSSGSGMRNAASDAFLLGQSFDKGGQESATFSAQVLALSGRAVALNPALGQTGDVANGLVRALSSGRDKGLQPFNLGLSGTEITARAASLALAEGRDTVTAADKAFAGAALAVEKLGGHLQEDIGRGADNPILKARQLQREFSSLTTEIGRPLIAPAFELLEAGIPIAATAGQVLGEVAQTALPALTGAVQLAAPALQLLAGTIGVVNDVIQAVPGGTAAAGAALGFLVGGPIGAVIGGFGGLASEIGLFSDGAEDATIDVAELTKKLQGLNAAQAAQAFLSATLGVKSFAAAFRDGVDTSRDALLFFDEVRSTFRQLAYDSPATAQAVIAGLQAQGANVERFTEILQRQIAKRREDDAASAESRQENELLTGSVEELTDALLAQYDASFAASRAVDSQRDAQAKLTEAYLASLNPENDAAASADNLARAQRDTEEATLKAAVSLGQKAEADNVGLGAAGAHSAGINAQIGYLQGLAGGLAPESPLRQFIEQYIGRLTAIPENRHTAVTADVSQAIDAVDNLIGRYSHLGSLALSGLRGDIDPQRKSQGGYVDGPRGAGDIVPALLSPGEFVLSRQMLTGAAAVPGEITAAIGAGIRIPAPTINVQSPVARGGDTVVNLNLGDMHFHGARPTRAEATTIGRAVGDAAADALTRRGIFVAARTG